MNCLKQGLFGWEVTDCVVAITRLAYEAPMTAAVDFRNLTPMIVLRALAKAGSAVYEPTYAVELEIPGDALSAVIAALASRGADVRQATGAGAGWVVPCEIPVRALKDLAMALPRLTHGQGSIWYQPGGDRRVRGQVPVRERFDGNPLDHDEYMRYLSNKEMAG